MRKFENYLVKSKGRIDRNSRSVAIMKANHAKYGGFLIGNKNQYFITNPRSGVLISRGVNAYGIN